jgi:hypothetical protein
MLRRYRKRGGRARSIVVSRSLISQLRALLRPPAQRNTRSNAVRASGAALHAQRRLVYRYRSLELYL